MDTLFRRTSRQHILRPRSVVRSQVAEATHKAPAINGANLVQLHESNPLKERTADVPRGV